MGAGAAVCCRDPGLPGGGDDVCCSCRSARYTDWAWRPVLALPSEPRSGWPLYLWGGLTATSVEYIYHWWGEIFLGVSFWDYTGVFGNFRGRVCLPFSLAWGLLLFPAVYLVTPPVVALADRVPIGVTWWLLLAFTADAVCSLRFFGGDP